MGDLLPSLHALSLSTVDTEMPKRSASDAEIKQEPESPSAVQPAKKLMTSTKLFERVPYGFDAYVRPHQMALAKAVVEGIDDEDWGSTLLCTYGTGTGKTRAALVAAAQWMLLGRFDATNKYARTVVAIVPKATMEQWRLAWEELVDYLAPLLGSHFRDTAATPFPASWGVLPSTSLYRHGNLILATRDAIYAKESYFSSLFRLHEMMFVLDEAHTVRNILAEDAKILPASLLLAKKCGYVLLLTATPLMNTLADLDVLIAFLLRETELAMSLVTPDVDPSGERTRLALIRRFAAKRRIVHYAADESAMPRAESTIEHVLLDKRYARLARVVDKQGEVEAAALLFGSEPDAEKRMAMYSAREKVENAFLVEARQATNAAKYPRLSYDLYTGTARRVVVASSFLARGVGGFYEYLRKMRTVGWEVTAPEAYGGRIEVLRLGNDDIPDRPVMEVCWWTDNKHILDYKAWYEATDTDVLKVLLLSPKASVGVSLKRTEELHLMEPYFSPGAEAQVMGRVMRIDSHLHLEPQDRVVKVIRWHGIVPRPGTAPTAPIDLTGSGPGPSSAQAIDASAEHLISADERVADINAQKRAALREPQQLLQQIGLTNLRELYGSGAAAPEAPGASSVGAARS